MLTPPAIAALTVAFSVAVIWLLARAENRRFAAMGEQEREAYDEDRQW
jgi:hypothetical protein